MSAAHAVICNAGPLIALGKLNRLDLLAAVYGQVSIPEPVYDEVVVQGAMRGEPDARLVRIIWQRQRWPIVPVDAAMLSRVQPSAILGRGEMAVLALAATHADPEVLMDDAAARAEAKRMGLRVRGTLGVLVQAYRQGRLSLPQAEFLIEEIADRADIWISAQLCRRVAAHLRHGPPTET